MNFTSIWLRDTDEASGWRESGCRQCRPPCAVIILTLKLVINKRLDCSGLVVQLGEAGPGDDELLSCFSFNPRETHL